MFEERLVGYPDPLAQLGNIRDQLYAALQESYLVLRHDQGAAGVAGSPAAIAGSHNTAAHRCKRLRLKSPARFRRTAKIAYHVNVLLPCREAWLAFVVRSGRGCVAQRSLDFRLLKRIRHRSPISLEVRILRISLLWVSPGTHPAQRPAAGLAPRGRRFPTTPPHHVPHVPVPEFVVRGGAGTSSVPRS